MFPSVTSSAQQTQGTGEDTRSGGHVLRARLWGFPPVPSQTHSGYQGTCYELCFPAQKTEARSSQGPCQGHPATER